MQQILTSLSWKAVVLMGKTGMCKAMQSHLENTPATEEPVPQIQGNVGFLHGRENLTEIRGMLLPKWCQLPPMLMPLPCVNTNLRPETIFQALAIITVSRGTTETLRDMQLAKTGDIVGANEITSPFSLERITQQVFSSGGIYNLKCSTAQSTLHSRFLQGVCSLLTQLLPPCPILSSVDTSGSWFCLWRLITSLLLKRSRPSWQSICICGCCPRGCC